jgi:hypothetical protein
MNSGIMVEGVLTVLRMRFRGDGVSGSNQRLGLAWLALIVFALIIQFSALRSNHSVFIDESSSLQRSSHRHDRPR